MADRIQYATLKNKSAIVTGGASGLGLATATRWAEHGAYVTLADMNTTEGEKAVSNLTSKGYKVSFIQCDVTSWESSVAAFKHATNFSPRKTLDIAGLFAGMGGDPDNLTKVAEASNPRPSLNKDPVETSKRIIDVNLDGQVRSAELAMYYFRLPTAAESPPVAEGPKSVFLVSSLGGYIDYNPTMYCISKYGVRGLFRSIRLQAKIKENNFTVNLVAPGYTESPMTLKHGADAEGQRQQTIKYVTEKGLWAPVEAVVEAASLAVTGGWEVNGRSFATYPSGFHDMLEDLDSGYGGEELLRKLEAEGYRQAGFAQ